MSAEFMQMSPTPIMGRTPIFVFGSNLQGRHGKGAALVATLSHGAKRGQGEGMQGRSYAIPTKATPYAPLPLAAVGGHVARFLEYARKRRDYHFNVTAIGCGHAGFTPAQIAPMFHDALTMVNVTLPAPFLEVLCSPAHYRRLEP